MCSLHLLAFDSLREEEPPRTVRTDLGIQDLHAEVPAGVPARRRRQVFGPGTMAAPHLPRGWKRAWCGCTDDGAEGGGVEDERYGRRP